MLRKKAATLKKQTIKWRSHEPTRLETFSDAVFAFAVTLIIVSLEVPKSFDELFETMKGFVSFGICFTLLFIIWNNQNIFFRRYGLVDAYTTFLNGVLLFVVLTYTYPLKFLFTLLLSGDATYLNHGLKLSMIRMEQVPTLMYIYNIGYTLIYLLFYLMYTHARKHTKHLELSEYEVFETNSQIYINLINALVGVIAILLTFVLPMGIKGDSGFAYFLLTLAYPVFFSYRGRRSRKLFGATA